MTIAKKCEFLCIKIYYFLIGKADPEPVAYQTSGELTSLYFINDDLSFDDLTIFHGSAMVSVNK